MAACGIPAAMAVRFDRQGSAWNIAVFAVVFPFVHFCVMHCARRTPSQATELLYDGRLGLGLLVPAHDRPVGREP